MIIVVLAAGRGDRMNSSLPQVLLPAAGRKMIFYALETARALNPEKICVVLGHKGEELRAALEGEGDLLFCTQGEQKGTSDAVLAARPILEGYRGEALILCGDMPALSSETLSTFIKESPGGVVSFITYRSKNPTGYGRVVRATNRNVLRIAEEEEANPLERKIAEVSSGLYFADTGLLLNRLAGAKTSHLSSIVGEEDAAWRAPEGKEEEFYDANDRVQLAALSRFLWRKRALEFMKRGVGIIDPDSVYIDPAAEVGRDTTLYPNVYIEGGSVIKEGVVIRHGSRIVDSSIGEGCEIRENTLIEKSILGKSCKVGPMAHIRPGSSLAGENSVGNFVELKKVSLGAGSKANHLTYLGDAFVGSGVNIGCGTITCNYDGAKKHETVIGNDVFVGSDVQFVAPVTVGDGAVLGAGSTITKDVPRDALAVARAEQKNFAGKGKEYKERVGSE